ncbi:MAG TPA: VIT domain-containing protein [Lacipirellula sp.]
MKLTSILVSIAALLAALLTSATANFASAQGLLVDVRPGHHFRLPRPIWPPRPEPAPESYQIESLEVNAKLADTTARVQVSQAFKNTGSGQLEVCFVFPLPYDGAIDQLTLLVNGKEFPAKLLSKEEARRRYEEIVRSSRDPALLEWVGAGMFQTSVFPIPAGESRTVTLRYTQLCRRSHGLTDFIFPLSTARYTDGRLDKLSVRVSIESPADIKNIYSPSHEVEIDRDGKLNAVVKLDAKNTIPTEDFRLFYDTGDNSIAASVVSYRPDDEEDGYFLLLATPELETDDDIGLLPAKSVLFVVDRSGSMSGEKMDQAKEALKFVLNNLRKGDTFNIIAYDSEIESFRPELQKFDDEARAAATGFVNGLYAGGSTNIAGALERALDMLQDDGRPAYVIFLTDGLPTVGETGEAAIAKLASENNDVRARIFPFGVGYDVNSRLLDKLAHENHGQSEYVRPEEDIENSVSKLYRRIGAPVMTDVELTIDVDDAKESDGPTVARVYPEGTFDLFAGDQFIMVGRYQTPGDSKITIAGEVNGEKHSFDFPAELVEESDDDAKAFVAKLWATRRVGEIIDEIDLKGRNEELVEELVALATEHGILTPYTSFLADETSETLDETELRRNVEQQLGALEAASGDYAFRQREGKSYYRMAARPAAGAGGFGGALPADAAAEPASLERIASTGGHGVWYYDAVQDKQVVTDALITVGRKTFFKRGQQWIDSSVTAAEQKSARRIERFSREYFDLIDRHGQHVAQYLAIEDQVCVKLDGQVYQW